MLSLKLDGGDGVEPKKCWIENFKQASPGGSSHLGDLMTDDFLGAVTRNNTITECTQPQLLRKEDNTVQIDRQIMPILKFIS